MLQGKARERCIVLTGRGWRVGEGGKASLLRESTHTCGGGQGQGRRRYPSVIITHTITATS
eukprot:3669782-Rhodomonas_salina.1